MPLASVKAIFLSRGGSRLAHVVPADRDRVPSWDPLAAVREQIGHEPHRGLRRVDVRAARGVLLEHVVLDGPVQGAGRDPLLLRDQLVQEQQDRGGGVDRHRGGHAIERDALEQASHVIDGADRDPGLADLPFGPRMVRVEAHLGRQVEGHREPRLAVIEEIPEAAVRILRRAHPSVLAHGPEPFAIHRRVRAAGERGSSGLAELGSSVPPRERVGSVHGLELDARVGGSPVVRHGRSLPASETPPVGVAPRPGLHAVAFAHGQRGSPYRRVHAEQVGAVRRAGAPGDGDRGSRTWFPDRGTQRRRDDRGARAQRGCASRLRARLGLRVQRLLVRTSGRSERRGPLHRRRPEQRCGR